MKKRKKAKLKAQNILVLCEDSVSFNNYVKFYLKSKDFNDFPIDRKTRSRERIKDKTIKLKRVGSEKEILVEIKQAKEYSNPEKIVDEAENELEKYDIIFCEFDYDASKPNCGNRKKEYDEVLNQTLNKNIILINFNLCFESWLLAHFTNSSKVYESSNEIIKELNDIYKLNYKKGKIDQPLFDKLKDKLSNAVKNAKQVENCGGDLAIKFYIFMDYIENLCK